MSELPHTQIQANGKARPKLVIFDDRGKLLKALTDKFTALGYDVTPVYVSDGNYDHVIKDGRFRRGPAKPPVSDDWREQDKQITPAYNLDRAFADAEERFKAGNNRYRLEKEMYEGMLALPPHAHAITSEKEVAALLRELSPDCVLTDYEMRKGSTVTATKRLMGDDVMRVAHEVVPQAARALHSSLYTFFDQKDFESFMELAGDVKDSRKEEYEDTLQEAAERGYLIASKDVNPMGNESHSAQYATVLDKYFRHALAHGKPPRIEMGAQGFGVV